MPASPVPDPLALDAQLCFPLYAAARLVTRLYQPLLEPLGLTYPQYIVLLILWEDSPCTVSHLCARAQLNTNTLTPLLKRLEALGFVARTRSKQDERMVEVRLTEAGAALRARCACIPASVFAAVGMPLDQAIALRGLLGTLIDRLSDAAGTPGEG